MGVVTGYHLHLAGASVSFVVRPGRSRFIPQRFTLYSYDDASLQNFEAFGVGEDVSVLETTKPDAGPLHAGHGAQ
ncbi:hypothetical protein [Xenophilus azovorans]|uniref:hypothetical protein n=1 Tax=Xenophilus azovorans TaxID=151755 RepID=UPI00056E6487|nr:hypothetical protein [Xenophilus azovorans]